VLTQKDDRTPNSEVKLYPTVPAEHRDELTTSQVSSAGLRGDETNVAHVDAVICVQLWGSDIHGVVGWNSGVPTLTYVPFGSRNRPVQVVCSKPKQSPGCTVRPTWAASKYVAESFRAAGLLHTVRPRMKQ
jgi:hypothetical protein